MSSDKYASPYTKPMQQYPSQSEDYLSFEFGGAGQATTPQQNRRFTSTPARQNDNNGGGNNSSFFNNRRGQQRFQGGYNNRRNHSGLGFQQNQQQNRWNQSGNGGGGSGNNQRRGGGGGGQGHWQQKNKPNFKNVYNFEAYFHASMLEDPWAELVERHNAIRKSEIKMQVENDEARPLPASDSDGEEDKSSESDEAGLEDEV